MYKISIIGGGISGLSAAIALSRFDLNIKVFEKSIRFSKLGAGIQLGPNAACVISSLGIYEEVLKKSSAPKNFFVYDINSKKYLYKKPLGKNQIEIYGYPYLTILRSDLHSLYDQGLIYFDENYIIRLSERLKISEQYKYLDDDYKIHIIKFENLEEEFHNLMKKYNLDIKLNRHKNKSENKKFKVLHY